MLSEATWQAASAIRTPEWKLIRFYQTTLYGRSGIELYDVAADPTSSTTWPTSTPRWPPTSTAGSATGSRPNWPGAMTRCSR